MSRLSLESFQFNSSGRPVLLPGEVELGLLSKVDVEFNEEASVIGSTFSAKLFKEGRIQLTSHRLLFLEDKKRNSNFFVPLGAVHSSSVSTKLFSATKLKIHLALDFYSKPAADGGIKFEKMYIHSHGRESVDQFQKSLDKAVKSKAWQTMNAFPYNSYIPAAASPQLRPDPNLLQSLMGMGFQQQRCEQALIQTGNKGVEEAVNWLISNQQQQTQQYYGGHSSPYGMQHNPYQFQQPHPQQQRPQYQHQQQPQMQQTARVNTTYVGVGGIIKKEAEKAEKEDSSLSQAFQDLKNLMGKAQDMVTLAERLKSTLSSKGKEAGEGDQEEEEEFQKELQDDMLNMGIASPVTRESSGARYYVELAKQLSSFLAAPMKRSFGMMTLQDTFCWFNRARGVELVSPDDLMIAVEQFKKINAPYQVKKLSGSGVMVVVSLQLDEEVICNKIGDMVQAGEQGICGVAVTSNQVAQKMGVPVSIAQEHLLLAEKKLVLCRDDGPEGLRFFRNFFMDSVFA
eukprot:TRINITY_DN6043_c0_g2_i1.p1 TRINITY_DN6043_c0_g2~~TRINITY_DN6043_c0_g2_i1.p1  ORF type:complete len:536 (-),score=76.62 TRINITY_DN6043_c0_g2_i1:243-1778(-)